MFTREQKYLVLSLKDIQEGLDEGQKMALAGYLSKLENTRKARGKQPIDAVVVDKNSLGEKAFEDAYKIVEDAVKAKEPLCDHEWEVEGVGCMGGGYVLRCKKCNAQDIEF